MAWLGGEHRNENVAILVLAVFVLLTATYAVFTHPGPGPDSGEVSLDRLMPPDYKPVLAGLVRASGGECDSVCSACVTEPPLGQLRVRAACTIAAKHIGCDSPRDFDIVVTPAVPNPSR